MEDRTLTQINDDLNALNISSATITHPEYSWFRNIPKLSDDEINSNSANGLAYLDSDKNIISYRLMIQRFQQNQRFFENLTDEIKLHYIDGNKLLISSLKEKRSSEIAGTSNEKNKDDDVDYEFWLNVVSDYEETINKDPVKFYEQITNGIPDRLRGIIWQTIVNSKCAKLENLYDSELSSRESPKFDKQIRKDLSRTRFVSSSTTSGSLSSVIDKSENLYNIIKSYSIFDPEVGYTQGMAFVVIPILINLNNENETFSLFVKLMQLYEFRDLYLPDMPRLHVLLYQFERLLEDKSPKLFNHLNKQGIKSSMYASQWFLTMFSYKFPLDIVIRIYDVIMIEGIEATLKFAILLMLKNEPKLLTLNFDQLVDFLKENLFDYYYSNDAEDNNGGYRVNELVSDAMKVKLVPSILNKYQLEHEAIHKLERQRDEELEQLRSHNSELLQKIKKLESNYESLNKNNVEITNEMIQKKVNLANLDDENIELKDEIAQLNEKLTQFNQEEIDFVSVEQYYIDDNVMIGKLKTDNIENAIDFENELNRTMEQNLEVMETNRMLEEQLSILDKQYKDNKTELDKVKEEYEYFISKYNITIEKVNNKPGTKEMQS